jgi:hypothetical protein
MTDVMLETGALELRPIVGPKSISFVRNPCFFIVGFDFSGTRRLATLLDAHPQVAVAPELNWITDFFDTLQGPNLEGLLAWPQLSKWIYQKEFESLCVSSDEVRKTIELTELLPCHLFLSRILDIHGNKKCKERVGSWTPEFMRYLDILHDSYPWAKFIHPIRDGRKVCLELLDQPDDVLRQFSTWSEDPLLTIAPWWNRKIQQCRRAGQRLGPAHYYELRYENLRTRPEEEIARLCDFLGVSFDEEWVRSYASTTSGDSAGCDPSQNTLSKGRGDWRTQLHPEDIERFEAAAGELLEELGYERAFHRPRTEAVACVSRLGQEFAHPTVWRKTSPQSLVRRRAKAGWTNPFVFIVGCPRSGTTLMQRILDAHPHLAICPESFWVVYFYKKCIGLTHEGHVTPELISQLLTYYKFYRMKAAKADLAKLIECQRSISYADFVTGIFDHYGEYWQKPLVGDKTPDYVRNLSTLRFLWPQAKIVHLIRDGRDVCLSAINWKRKADRLKSQFSTWEQHPVTTAALWWKWHICKGLEDNRSLGQEHYFEMRYEALIAQPEEECARLCDFLGLPLDQSMLKFHEGRIKTEVSLDAKNAWMPITPGLRNWRTQMPPEDVERFEAAAGDLLGELGYSRAFPKPAGRVLEETAEIRKTFVGDARHLGDWLP